MNKLAAALNFMLALIVGATVAYTIHDVNPEVFDGYSEYHPCDKMPIVKTRLPPLKVSIAPIEKRDESVRYYLQASVRIHNGSSAGSGTICHYDHQNRIAYIISCGHLFRGNMTPGGSGTKNVRIDVFYKNHEKLEQPQSYLADVICYDNDEDIAFLKFRPDWVPQRWFAIAPVDYKMNVGESFESTGCDGAREVASYSVRIVEGINSGRNLITQDNSPRPGRSGGALLSSDGYYLAIVWGTSALDGSGYGFYVPLRRIHAYASKHPEISWLLEVGKDWGFINEIPIFELNGQRRRVPNHYIPVP